MAPTVHHHQELGHLLGSAGRGLHEGQDIVAAGRSRNRSDMRANALAAALLMPQTAEAGLAGIGPTVARVGIMGSQVGNSAG